MQNYPACKELNADSACSVINLQTLINSFVLSAIDCAIGAILKLSAEEFMNGG